LAARNPHTRRFADVPGTRRPRVEPRFPKDPELNVITGVRREPCPGCGTRLTVHVAGCVREFPY